MIQYDSDPKPSQEAREAFLLAMPDARAWGLPRAIQEERDALKLAQPVSEELRSEVARPRLWVM